MNNFKLILIQDNITTTLIVRNKQSGSVPVGSTLDILGLEQVPYKELVPAYKQIKSNDDMLSQECSVCMQTYKFREYKRKLKCDHVFHKRCIDKWLKSNLSCPICRKDIGD